MIKNIFKEIFVTILLLAIMLLLLGIVFYDSIPSKKIIPEVAIYETPQNIKDEITSTSNVGFQNEILTYELTESDLKLYKNVKIYTPGKDNPFIDDTFETKVMENSIKANTNINTSYNKIVQ